MIVLKLEMRISTPLDAHLVNRAEPRDTANRCDHFLIDENYFG